MSFFCKRFVKDICYNLLKRIYIFAVGIDNVNSATTVLDSMRNRRRHGHGRDNNQPPLSASPDDIKLAFQLLMAGK